MAKYLYFSNKKRCLSINEQAYQHLFIKFEDNALYIQSFCEHGLFNHKLERGKLVDININEIRDISFIKSGGLVWLKINLKLDALIIAPKTWLDTRYFKLISKLRNDHEINNYKQFEKYIYKNKYMFKDYLFYGLLGMNKSLEKFKNYLGEFYYNKLIAYLFKKRKYLLRKKFYYLDDKYLLIDKIVAFKDINEFNQYLKNL